MVRVRRYRCRINCTGFDFDCSPYAMTPLHARTFKTLLLFTRKNLRQSYGQLGFGTFGRFTLRETVKVVTEKNYCVKTILLEK